MTAYWIVLGVAAWVLVILLVLGMCRSAAEGDRDMDCEKRGMMNDKQIVAALNAERCPRCDGTDLTGVEGGCSVAYRCLRCGLRCVCGPAGIQVLARGTQ